MAFGDTAIVDIKQRELSEFDLQEQLHDELQDLVATGLGKQLVVNLTNVEIIGSHAIAVFVDARRRLHQNGGQFAFCNMNSNVRLSFQVLNLEGTLFEIFDSEPEALNALS